MTIGGISPVSTQSMPMPAAPTPPPAAKTGSPSEATAASGGNSSALNIKA